MQLKIRRAPRLAWALGLLAALAMAGASTGDAAAAGPVAETSGFKQCGDIPSKFLWSIRGQSVGCDKSRKVAKRWLNRGQAQGFPNVITFKQWRCTSNSYGDGSNVKCKRGKNDEVRFAAGG